MRIANFNVQNLRLRHTDDGMALDGAVDRDMGAHPDPVLDRLDRRLTAKALHTIDADIVALQEVFDLATLDYFHDRFLVPEGTQPYPYRHCLPGNDGQGMNVALLSRVPPVSVTSHASETASNLGLEEVPEKLQQGPIFRRDCLEAEFPELTLFICHFKAPYPDPEEAHAVRHAEARAVRRIIERRFPDSSQAPWLVIGDLNEPWADTPRSALTPLTDGFAVDLMARLPKRENWTFSDPDTGRHSHPDALLASPALAAAFPMARPGIFRTGLDPSSGGPSASLTRPHASDHAAIFIDLKGL